MGTKTCIIMSWLFCLLISINAKPLETTNDSSSASTTTDPLTSCGGIKGFFKICPVENATTTIAPPALRHKRDEWGTESNLPDDSGEASDESLYKRETDDSNLKLAEKQRRDIGDQDPEETSGIEDEPKQKREVSKDRPKRDDDSDYDPTNGSDEDDGDDERKRRAAGEVLGKKNRRQVESSSEKSKVEEENVEEREASTDKAQMDDSDSDSDSDSDEGDDGRRKRETDETTEKKNRREVDGGEEKDSEENEENDDQRRKRNDYDGDSSDGDEEECDGNRKKREAEDMKETKIRRDIPPLGGASPPETAKSIEENSQESVEEGKRKRSAPIDAIKSSETKRETTDKKQRREAEGEKSRRDIPPLGGASPPDNAKSIEEDSHESVEDEKMKRQADEKTELKSVKEPLTKREVTDDGAEESKKDTKRETKELGEPKKGSETKREVPNEKTEAEPKTDKKLKREVADKATEESKKDTRRETEELEEPKKSSDTKREVTNETKKSDPKTDMKGKREATSISSGTINDKTKKLSADKQRRAIPPVQNSDTVTKSKRDADDDDNSLGDDGGEVKREAPEKENDEDSTEDLPNPEVLGMFVRRDVPDSAVDDKAAKAATGAAIVGKRDVETAEKRNLTNQ